MKNPIYYIQNNLILPVLNFHVLTQKKKNKIHLFYKYSKIEKIHLSN